MGHGYLSLGCRKTAENMKYNINMQFVFWRWHKFCTFTGTRKIRGTSKTGCGHLKESYLNVK
jgi:hypothetical protein